MTPTNRQKAHDLLDYAEFLAKETSPGTRSVALALVAVGGLLMELTEVLESQLRQRGDRSREGEK